MTSLLIPETIDIEGENIGSIWSAWRTNWTHYYVASEMSIKKPETRIAILLNILGPTDQKIYNTFKFTEKEKEDRLIETVINSFEKYT